ncbi:MAG: siroheme synthase CysG [Granulosicoccus sp.]
MNTSTDYKPIFPVFTDLSRMSVLIVGGGELTVTTLERFEHTSAARLKVIATTASPAIQALCSRLGIKPLVREFREEDLAGITLLFASSESTTENAQLAEAAHQAGILVNVPDQQNIGSFSVPAVIERYPLLVAVGSSVDAPEPVKLLSRQIAAFLPVNYGALGQLYARYKQRVIQAIPDRKQRQAFWQRLFTGRIADAVLQGQHAEADTAISMALETGNPSSSQGEVYLVGAGPGDPDLLTFRALRLMQQCDVMLYDRLVSDDVLSLVNPEAERIYVGKRLNHHAVPQESINQQLATLAKQGKRVLRLKGGDPFIFGRGGEEIDTLVDEGVDFQVVPGITAASGCSSYSGIPLTHRDYAQVCLFVTGHLRDGSVNLDWPSLARPGQTVVIYMGLVGLPVICQQLQEHGLESDHPVAIIAKGTRRNQRVISGTLANLPDKVATSDIKAPTLIIVGHVVKLRERLAWFETRQNT